MASMTPPSAPVPCSASPMPSRSTRAAPLLSLPYAPRPHTPALSRPLPQTTHLPHTHAAQPRTPLPSEVWCPLPPLRGCDTRCHHSGRRRHVADMPLARCVLQDYLNNRIRRVDVTTGATTTLAGSTNGFNDAAVGTSARFNSPSGVAIDPSGTFALVGVRASPASPRPRVIAPFLQTAHPRLTLTHRTAHSPHHLPLRCVVPAATPRRRSRSVDRRNTTATASAVSKSQPGRPPRSRAALVASTTPPVPAPDSTGQLALISTRAAPSRSFAYDRASPARASPLHRTLPQTAHLPHTHTLHTLPHCLPLRRCPPPVLVAGLPLAQRARARTGRRQQPHPPCRRRNRGNNHARGQHSWLQRRRRRQRPIQPSRLRRDRPERHLCSCWRTCLARMPHPCVIVHSPADGASASHTQCTAPHRLPLR